MNQSIDIPEVDPWDVVPTRVYRKRRVPVSAEQILDWTLIVVAALGFLVTLGVVLANHGWH